MSFDRRDIRPSMDVYTLDNVYLGTVLRVTAGTYTPPEPATVSPAQGSSVNGEQLGPMPTQSLGNPGPRTQGAANRYATAHARPNPLGNASILVGKWWGISQRRRIPLAWVQSVSLERVVLSRRKAELL